MFQAWNEYSESERPIAIQDALQIKGLPATAANEERIERLVEERIRGPLDAPYRKGDEWGDEEDTAWIWDQWIAQGFCNVLIAAQKTGKSTFFLSLVAELSKRTGSFLNFSLSEKNEIGFLLIGPDMSRKLWKDYGQKAGLLSRKDNGKFSWASTIEAVYTEETGIGLDRQGINKIVGHCKAIKEEGKHPFVICDSYSALMANSHPSLDENSANYTNPLRKLKQAISKESATLLMIHHSSISGSKRDTATSASGHQNWGRVPDQILNLKWLQSEPGPDGSRSDNRVVLSATGRTGSVAKPQLLEQSPNWGWSSHGDTSDALRHRHALEQRDKLMGDDATLYDLLNQRTRHGLASTTLDISELHSISHKAQWSLQKINRLCRKLERKSLAVITGEKPPIGDMGGRPQLLWETFERFEDETGRFPELYARPGSSENLEGCSASKTPMPRASSQITQNTQGGEVATGEVVPGVVPSEPPEPSGAYVLGMTWEEPSDFFHESEGFPEPGAIVEDTEGQSHVVLDNKKAGAQMLMVSRRGQEKAPLKERRWMVDVFPVGWKAKQEETELYLELEKDVRI